MAVHGQLMNVDGNVGHAFFDRTGIFIEHNQAAHLVAGVNLGAVCGDAKRRHVSPLINVVAISIEALDTMFTTFRRG